MLTAGVDAGYLATRWITQWFTSRKASCHLHMTVKKGVLVNLPNALFTSLLCNVPIDRKKRFQVELKVFTGAASKLWFKLL